jgi:hypothetical protein
MRRISSFPLFLQGEPHDASLCSSIVMAGLVPAIHVFLPARQGVDAGARPGMTEQW